MRGPVQSRIKLNARILACMRADGTGEGLWSASDVARALDEKRQRVEHAMLALARDGVLVDGGTVTRHWKPARAYRLAENERQPPPEPPAWRPVMSLQPASSCAVGYLDRYFDWVCNGKANGELDELDRAAFWMIEAALKSPKMTGAHGIALLHVHGRSVWCFGRLDMRAVYIEALDMVERRLEPVIGARTCRVQQ